MVFLIKRPFYRNEIILFAKTELVINMQFSVYSNTHFDRKVHFDEIVSSPMLVVRVIYHYHRTECRVLNLNFAQLFYAELLLPDTFQCESVKSTENEIGGHQFSRLYNLV